MPMERRNRLEWIVLALSVVAIAAVLGVLTAEGFGDHGRPPIPAIDLHPGRGYATPAGWIVPATATNRGDRSARSVTFEATARVHGREEQAEVTVSYLPAGSDVEVAFGFSEKPEGDIRIRITGFIP